jgi:hypothetical protein
VPVYAEPFSDEGGYDAALAALSNEERLAYFNQAAAGLETAEIQLSGIFSCGANTLAQISTRSEHVQHLKTSDAQIRVVLSHATLKWELMAHQSAHRKAALNRPRCAANWRSCWNAISTTRRNSSRSGRMISSSVRRPSANCSILWTTSATAAA